jgi:hypothetical protein
VIFQGFIMYFYPEIESFGIPLLVDIYDPFHLEGLELRKLRGAWRALRHGTTPMCRC